MADQRRLLSALITNATPLAGVLFLDWSLLALLVVYWAELGIGLTFATVRGLFAQRPPEMDSDALLIGAFRHKRGGVSVPGTGLRLQLANVPVALLGLPMFGLVWLVIGVIAIGSAGEAVPGVPFDEQAAVALLLGVSGVVVGRGYDTVTGYFLDGAYEEASVQRALWSGAWPVLVVGFAMVVGGSLAAAGQPLALALATTVSAKFLFDLVDVYRDRLVAFDERDQLDLGFASEPDAWPTVEAQPSPVETVCPNRAALVVDGIVRGTTTPFVLFIGCLGVLASVLAQSSGATDAAVFIARWTAGLVGVFAILGIIDRLVRHLWMEYRVNADVLGHDRLLGGDLWRVPSRTVRQCDPEQTVADRMFGTVTYCLEHDGETYRMPHVPDDCLAGLEPAPCDASPE